MGPVKVTNQEHNLVFQNGTTHKGFTVADTAGSLETLGSFTFNANTEYVLIQIQSQPVRITFDGATTPTATVGFSYAAGTKEVWSIDKAKDALLVREGGTSADVELQEFTHKA